MTVSKPELRRQLLVQRAADPLWKQKQVSQGIFQRLLTIDAFQRCKVIMLYCSTDNEISTDCIIEYCLKQQKQVCIPRCQNKGVMSAYYINSLADLQLGKYGIREPDKHSIQVPRNTIDLIVAPCLGADRRGFRLGYGGGYYDRFLQNTRAMVIALCASSRLFVRLPTDSFDQRCHAIVTEKEVVAINEK